MRPEVPSVVVVVAVAVAVELGGFLLASRPPPLAATVPEREAGEKRGYESE